MLFKSTHSTSSFSKRNASLGENGRELTGEAGVDEAKTCVGSGISTSVFNVAIMESSNKDSKEIFSKIGEVELE